METIEIIDGVYVDVPTEDELIAAHYRWWTCSVSREHVKLGPLALTWYRWTDSRWRLDAVWLCRHRVTLGGQLV